MRRPGGILVAVGLGVALVVGVAILAPLSSLRGNSPEARGSSPPDAGALLSPATGGRAAGQIAALQSRLKEGEGEDWRLYASLGLAYLQEARAGADPSFYVKAAGVLRRSLALNRSDNYEAMLGMGALASARHDFRGALAWGRRAKQVNPHNPYARGLIGDALFELGRYSDGMAAYQDMVDLRPDLASYARIAYARELTGDVRGAVEAMRLATGVASGSPEDGAWAYYQLGELLFGSGRVDDAEQAYRHGAALAPDYPLPPVGLAKIDAARGHPRAAARQVADVVTGYPAPEFAILAGDLFALAGERRKARAQYDLVRATQRLLRANGVDTDLEVALFNADHGLASERVVMDARSGYAKRPSRQASDALAWTLYTAGRYREARRYSHEALRLGTRNGLFHYHAGMIALRLGDRAGARDHLRKALTMNPHFSWIYAPQARRTLQRLRARL